jgi:hypothetical protein
MWLDTRKARISEGGESALGSLHPGINRQTHRKRTGLRPRIVNAFNVHQAVAMVHPNELIKLCMNIIRSPAFWIDRDQ